MYNLFVSANCESWDGEPWQIGISRCVREYTDTRITEKYGELDPESVVELKLLPCIFAYEAHNHLDPKFGVIRDIVSRQDIVRIEYELQPVVPFLTADDVERLKFELDISKWEMNRTHWAVKDVDLPKELHSARGIVLPPWTRQATKAVDITVHQFDVALSFPGEERTLVEQVARELERRIGPDSYFYDENYVSQLARPGLDAVLQNLYRDRSRLVVVFLGGDYQKKDWCGIEFRAIREIMMARDNDRIMFVRTDDGTVDGVFKTDGYVDARRFSPTQIAEFICERLELLQ